jgi:hypothetical protein
VHVVALAALVKLPAAQLVHTRSTVALPVVLTYMPEPQLVQLAQRLAGLLS